MKLNIIHLDSRIDGENLLEVELLTQNIGNYDICPGVIEPIPKKGIAKAHKQIGCRGDIVRDYAERFCFWKTYA